MVDALLKSPPTEPIRVCPACGDVMAAGFCASCAPPPARAYAQRDTAVAYSMARPNSASLAVDSRRAATEWVTGPEEVDPHTRKAHPAQLKVVRPEPEPGSEGQSSRGKRQTQIYRKKAEPLAAVARAWSLPEPDAPQSTATARHARPASPLRQPSGPVPAPEPKLVQTTAFEAAPEAARDPQSVKSPIHSSPAVSAEPVAPFEPVASFEPVAPFEPVASFEPEAALPDLPRTVRDAAARVEPATHREVVSLLPDPTVTSAPRPVAGSLAREAKPTSFDKETDTRPRGLALRVASIALAAGALVGIVVALVR